MVVAAMKDATSSASNETPVYLGLECQTRDRHVGQDHVSHTKGPYMLSGCTVVCLLVARCCLMTAAKFLLHPSCIVLVVCSSYLKARALTPLARPTLLRKRSHAPSIRMSSLLYWPRSTFLTLESQLFGLFKGLLAFTGTSVDTAFFNFRLK